MNKNRKLHLVAILVLGLFAFVAFTPTAQAKGKYNRGKTLYLRRCGPCFSMGWKWSPTTKGQSKKRWDLVKMAKEWSPAQVCTWMRRPARALKGKGCYPGRIPYRERLEILYYLSRRMEGPIRKPKLRRLMGRRAPKLRIRVRTPARRRKALKQKKNREQLKKHRRQSLRSRPRWTGKTKPPTDPVAKKKWLEKRQRIRREIRRREKQRREARRRRDSSQNRRKDTGRSSSTGDKERR